jgi:hypothetical protein
MNTYQNKHDQLAALSAPFKPEDVRQREQGGQMLNYYESSTIMKRLLDVMGTGYSIESGRVRDHAPDGKLRRVDMEVIVTLQWVDGTMSKLTGWGSSDVQYSKKDPENIVSDFMKSALTDGIKVALSKIGVGSELYDSNYRKKLETDKAKAEQEAREKAMFTCQGCQGEITGGIVGGKTLSREELVQQTRIKFKKRLCIECAKAAAKGGE